jgi:PelA/Pel-15E family pectate lyase
MKLRKILLFSLFFYNYTFAQFDSSNFEIDISGFYDSARHWYDIFDQGKIITPLKDQPLYKRNDITSIADNILLFQKDNGGWAKNYDMLAILDDEQKEIIRSYKSLLNTTFDNGASFSQTEYLAKAYFITKNERYKTGFLNGLDFILSAQYPSGGWPQFYPDTNGYQKHVTFNDGAMIGIMKLLQKIVNRNQEFSFLDADYFRKVNNAFSKGIDCILKCQIYDNGKLTAWCQQHNKITLKPEDARIYELASICNMESADIVDFLMSLENPDARIIKSVNSAVKWFEESKIFGIKVKTVQAEPIEYIYHSTTIDKVVVKDPFATPIWARFYELGTRKPLFSNRDGIKVYSLDKVERERRTGYAWYTYLPQIILDKYENWLSKNNLKWTQ